MYKNYFAHTHKKKISKTCTVFSDGGPCDKFREKVEKEKETNIEKKSVRHISP